MKCDGAQSLERFRAYLNLLARVHLNRQLNAKLSASDIVQDTLLEAHRKVGDFRGRTFAQQAAWLRTMLVHNAAKAGRDLRRQKRDVARERSLEAAMERSSVRLGDLLPAEQSSPSEKAMREERLLHVAEAVERLPEAQREAVLLHYLENLSMAEVGQRIGRSSTAVAGLLHRGLKRLRELLRETE